VAGQYRGLVSKHLAASLRGLGGVGLGVGGGGGGVDGGAEGAAKGFACILYIYT
jgi:hypothetical protein